MGMSLYIYVHIHTDEHAHAHAHKHTHIFEASVEASEVSWKEVSALFGSEDGTQRLDSLRHSLVETVCVRVRVGFVSVVERVCACVRVRMRVGFVSVLSVCAYACACMYACVWVRECVVVYGVWCVCGVCEGE